MHIESYAFGKMVIDGKMYTSDLLIYPDGRIEDSWWRKSGHVLCMDDIRDLVASRPETIIAGTGANGMMKPNGGLADALHEKGIALRAVPTGEAVRLFCELSRVKKVGAGFHLTC